jgi:hypothetical protein
MQAYLLQAQVLRRPKVKAFSVRDVGGEAFKGILAWAQYTQTQKVVGCTSEAQNRD